LLGEGHSPASCSSGRKPAKSTSRDTNHEAALEGLGSNGLGTYYSPPKTSNEGRNWNETNRQRKSPDDMASTGSTSARRDGSVLDFDNKDSDLDSDGETQRQFQDMNSDRNWTSHLGRKDSCEHQYSNTSDALDPKCWKPTIHYEFGSFDEARVWIEAWALSLGFKIRTGNSKFHAKPSTSKCMFSIQKKKNPHRVQRVSSSLPLTTCHFIRNPFYSSQACVHSSGNAHTTKGLRRIEAAQQTPLKTL